MFVMVEYCDYLLCKRDICDLSDLYLKIGIWKVKGKIGRKYFLV